MRGIDATVYPDDESPGSIYPNLNIYPMYDSRESAKNTKSAFFQYKTSSVERMLEIYGGIAYHWIEHTELHTNIPYRVRQPSLRGGNYFAL